MTQRLLLLRYNMKSTVHSYVLATVVNRSVNAVAAKKCQSIFFTYMYDYNYSYKICQSVIPICILHIVHNYNI